ALIGRPVVLTGVEHTGGGVMPAGFAGPEWSEIWVPLERVRGESPLFQQRDARVDARALARVRDGVAVEQAEAELGAIAASLARRHPDSNEGLTLRLSSLREDVVGAVRPSLVAMLLAAGLVLLLACANVAALLLGRAVERSRELAVRGALGASRLRLMRQLLTESLVLAGVGGLLGTALALVGVRVLATSLGTGWGAGGIPIPRLGEIGADPRALALALVVTLAAGVLFGMAPALSSTSSQPAARLREQGRGGGLGRGAARLHFGLAVGQLALAAALLAGAGLLLRSLEEIRAQDPGFQPEGLAVVRIFPPERYGSPEARASLFDRLEERARAIPGASGAALINHMPYGGGLVPTRIAAAEADSMRGAVYRTVSPDFFRVAGVEIQRGRAFTPAETRADVVVLSRVLADSLFPGERAVGRYVRLVNPTPPSERRGEVYTAVVVGVAADVRDSPRASLLPTVYVPHARDPWGNINVVVRSATTGAAVVGPLRQAVRDVDPELPVGDIHPLTELARASVARERVSTLLMLGFAALALILSIVGTYSALSNMALRRLREFGIRMALGAHPGDVRRLMLRRALAMVVPGVLLGVLGAWLLGRLLEGLLFQVAPTDAAALVGAAALLGGVGLLAGLLPALRAGRADPSRLLGEE
ncbi:MAG TPA: FtsX-like permease family protein, partial [Longimicrobiales bacterium]|nr:FtsX-like permease family protein [Longimicrobiales bacterium]